MQVTCVPPVVFSAGIDMTLHLVEPLHSEALAVKRAKQNWISLWLKKIIKLAAQKLLPCYFARISNLFQIQYIS